jgi:glycosyltransferase involved in cell wall biosynthesis
MEGSVIVVSANTAWFLWNFEKHLLVRLVKEGYAVHTISKSDPVIFEKLASIGCIPHSIHLNRKGMNPFIEMYALFQYCTLLFRLKPAILLNFTIKPVIYGSIASRVLKIPTINTMTGLGTGIIGGGSRAQFLLSLYKFSQKKVSYIFTLNKSDTCLLTQSHIGTSAIIDTCPGAGIDLNHFTYTIAQSDQVHLFLFVGRILKDKGIIEYIDAARQLCTQYPKIRFQILGSIDDENPSALTKNEFEEHLASCPTLEYLGAVEDVRPYLQAADCIVLPSYREGLPTALLEAMATGRPIITTLAPGCKDVVIEGLNGYTIPIKDSAALTHAMEKMIAAPLPQRTAMGAAGRERVEIEFSQVRVLEKYLCAINTLTKDFHKQ